jgi:hypothetical protein
MGDRTWVKLTIRETDKDLVTAEFGDYYNDGPNEDDVPGLIDLEYDEVNYGGYVSLEKLAKANPSLVLVGQHGAGSSYHAMSFHCLDGGVGFIDDHGEQPSVPVYFDPTGALYIDPKEAKKIREILLEHEEVRKLLGLPFDGGLLSQTSIPKGYRKILPGQKDVT